MGTDSALESHAVGTSSTEIELCKAPQPRPARPPDAVPEPSVALALSGGGFRATLCGIGAARFLADAGLLGRLRYSSSVSGGSVANGVLACGYHDLARDGFTGAAFDEHVLGPLVEKIRGRSFARKLLGGAWRTIGPATRTDVLANALDDWWFHGRTLAELSPDVRWIVNAANISTGVGFHFERDILGDYVLGHVSAADRPTRLAQAVAASASVPGVFARTLVDAPFPCGRGREARLLDGGAYDNSGLAALDHLEEEFLVAVNAGGTFRVGMLGRIPIVRDLQRANAILYKQSTGLRRQFMVDRFKAWEEAREEKREPPHFARRGVLFSLGTDMDASDEWSEGRPEHEEWRDELVNVKTSFDRFPAELCRRLVYRGWWLTGATMSRFHREMLPAELPAWRDVPA